MSPQEQPGASTTRGVLIMGRGVQAPAVNSMNRTRPKKAT